MKAVFALLLLAAAASAILRKPKSATSKVPAEAWLTTPELVARWGYPVETHTVHTDDGYLIDVHRITGPRLGGDKRDTPSGSKAGPQGPQGRTPVLLMHGFGATSECWVLRQNDNLAFMLADAQYDVWLGNFRGNFYGRRHMTLRPSDSRFWNFGWHENGVLDVAAMVDYVLMETQRASILYIGHSMGSTSALVLLSERPEYNAKLGAAFLLTPAVYFQHVRGGFSAIRKNMPWGYHSLAQFRLENFLTRRPLPDMCMPPNSNAVSATCWRLMEDAQGPFHSVVNNTYMPILLRHWPAGTSLGQAIHFGQLIVRGDGFYKYDFGAERNLAKYGTIYPPAYNLTNVQAPIFMYYCKNDYQAHYKDVRKLAADIPSLAGLYETPAEIFNHIDIVYEEDAAELVYKRLIDHMTKYR
ncbi:lipase 3-like [Thrips palmi]|uniref:Lipase n=1 Tax=Thrips palmi TaxID=161013 RepID=A0A6P8ZHP7_THRPL|nr:lipase 3-like [Thrips palmi]